MCLDKGKVESYAMTMPNQPKVEKPTNKQSKEVGQDIKNGKTHSL